jgi:monoamine oxidase
MMNKLTRANFLRLLFATTAATTFPLISCQEETESNNNNPPSSQEVDVIVIGAGMAGIMAASELTKQGLKVLILEGRNRIGGRIWTDNRWDVSLDLGAAWIQGSKGNPLTKLAQDFQVNTVPFDFDDSVVYTADGKELSSKKESRYEELFTELFAEIETFREKRENNDQSDISLQAALDEILKEEELNQEETQVLNFLLSTTIEDEYAGSLDDLSLYYWDQDGGFGGGDLIFPQGYEKLIQPLAKKLNIKLNHLVEKVEWSENIKVTTNQGILQSKYVVITLPVGVLKAGKVEFSPPLPDDKQQVIEHLGMGVLNKVLLKFPEVFWDDVQALNYISKNRGEWGEWVNFDPILKKPILLAFNSANFAIKLEQYSDTQIIKEAMQVLTTIYGDIPNPLDSIITRWHQDSFAYGSYSYMKIGSTSDDYKNLGKPIENKLFFAGEATSQQYPATVHGALLSGKRAAKEIILIGNK